jgi:hypothetical protein
MPGNARGAVLLEVLAAVAIFASAAVTTVGLLAQLADGTRRAQEAERAVADQERLLTAYWLLTRDDLDRRLGPRAVGLYVVEVQRPEPDLYRVSVGDSAGPELVTLLHRPEPDHAGR